MFHHFPVNKRKLESTNEQWVHLAGDQSTNHLYKFLWNPVELFVNSRGRETFTLFTLPYARIFCKFYVSRSHVARVLDLFTVCGRVSIAGTTKKAERPRARVWHAIFRHEKSHVRHNVIRMMSVVRSWHRFDKVPSTEESRRLADHREIRDLLILILWIEAWLMNNAFLYAFYRKKLNWIILLCFFSSSNYFAMLLFFFSCFSHLCMRIFVSFMTFGIKRPFVWELFSFNPLNSIRFQCCCMSTCVYFNQWTIKVN